MDPIIKIPYQRYMLLKNAYKILDKEHIQVVRHYDYCHSLYLKWLSKDSGYHYWLFEKWQILENGKEINHKPRYFKWNEFDWNTTSNVETFGVTLEKTIAVTSTVERPYWYLMEELAHSPDVYFLKKSFEPVETLDVEPPEPTPTEPTKINDWEKVRIQNSTLNFKMGAVAHNQEVTFTLAMRDQYSQTL